MKCSRFVKASLAATCALFVLAACGGGSSSDSNPPPRGTPPQTFSVTGTVSGLKSEGLTLTFNGRPVSVASGAATVTLGASLSTGISYTVTVQSQPTGQTCSVAHGSGTVQAGDVTDVAISCGVNAYVVGGSIGGLKVDGLVLVNNGDDATAIAANTRLFAMQSAIAHGDSYEISVRTQPVGGTCTVRQGAGVASADVDSVMISCEIEPFTVMHSFGADGDGIASYAALLQARDGNFYGTTVEGGANDRGTVFRLAPTGEETVLHSFRADGEGAAPVAELIQALDGNLYGTTSDEEFDGQGSVFRIIPP